MEAIMIDARKLSPHTLRILTTAGLVAVVVMNLNRMQAQAPTPVPKFEVASIKPCKADGADGGVRTGNFNGTSPARLLANCLSVKSLIQAAYLLNADGHYNRLDLLGMPIEGMPDWAQTDRYNIEAKPEGAPAEYMMKGPMLQALLEDRFQLKIRRETRQVPVFNLVVAKGGPKLQPFDGSCISVSDFAKPSPLGNPGNCSNVAGVSGSNLTRSWRGISIDNFVAAILGKGITGRTVINKTGIAGLFDIHLEFTQEQNLDKPDAGPSIFTALQEQLGLKLEPAKGPSDFVIVDHVERPSEN
jgi:uncharacterized protein (TIGR03435 family)